MGNNEARWQRMEEIYHAALPMGSAERHAFVAQRCAGDTVLMEEVNSLLVSDDFVAEFLQEPVVELGMAVLADEALRDTEIIVQPTQPESANLVGEKVADRYEVIKRMGGGGFGDVYKAADTKIMSRPVILKVLKHDVLKDDGAKREWVLIKFKQEIEALAKIDDSGVVHILDADTLPDGRPYIVMEFVEGSDLRQFMKEASRDHITEDGLKFHEVAEIVRQVGRTLTAAHEAEIFHRDLKPENIMLRRNKSGDLQVKVIDFGIAKVRNSLIAPSTASGLFVAGTWQYMAPEQLRAKKVDAACDIYALGIIAFEMVTGRYPFPAKDPAKLKELQEAGIKVKPCDLNPDLPVAAQKAILTALEFFPAERQKRARDFGDELSHALSSAEELVRPKPPVNIDLEGKTFEQLNEGERNKSDAPVISKPLSIAVPPTSLSSRKHLIYVCFAVLLAGMISYAAWRSFTSPAKETRTTPQLLPTNPGPERTLTFWLHVRMPRGDGTFEEFDTTGAESFKDGSKIYFRVQPAQEGYLYIINEGMGEGGAKKWTASFPNLNNNNKSAHLVANKQQDVTGMTLDDNPGEEVIHFVWAAQPVGELDLLFQFELKDNDGGVFGDPAQQNALQDFFQRNREVPENKSVVDNPQPRVTLKGSGNLLVASMLLKHRKYGG